MELSLIPTLTVFALFGLSGAAFFAARRTGVPYTVLLVAIGVALVALSRFEPFAFLGTFTLTPELLFYIFLPTLLFESAYNINIRALTRDAVPVALLAVASLLLSALAIAAGLYYLLPLVGFPIPFSVAFIFGALISTTDPVAVLALFKEYGAPRRLTLLFEGESIFNDGTGYALFLVALEFASRGGFATSTVLEGILSFALMLVGGAVFGLIIGGLFSKIIGWARSSESVSITLTLVLAHVTFLLTELVSEYLVIGGFSIHLSAIIATAVAAMVLGNYGRTKLPLGAEEFIEKFWGQIAFFANSIIFILVGMFAVSLPVSSPELFLPIALVVLVVASARALSIYGVVGPWNRIASAAQRIPIAWQHLLAWGSLRGALAVTMALLVPADLIVAGWAHDASIQSVILAFTTGCIFVTLFIKATTIGPFMQRLGVGTFTAIEEVQYAESRALIYSRVLERLDYFAQRNYITHNVHSALRATYAERLRHTKPSATHTRSTADATLRLWVLGIERDAAKELFQFNELSEHAYKRILTKLAARTDDAERGLATTEVHIRHVTDPLERLAELARHVLGEKPVRERPNEAFMYYRALFIIARKVDKELARIETEQSGGMFSADAVALMRRVYAEFRQDARKKMEDIATKNPDLAQSLTEKLARCGVLKVEEHVLDRLLEHQMITPKVFAALRDEFEHETRSVEPRSQHNPA